MLRYRMEENLWRSYILFQIPISEIYYVESVERKTFFYTKDEVYMADKKLYELEDLLAGTGIVRISKSCLMNVEHALPRKTAGEQPA